MMRHFPLICAKLVAASVLISHGWLVSAIHASAPVVLESSVKSIENPQHETLPDLAALGSVKERKQRFIDYLRPVIAEENLKLLALRERIKVASRQELEKWAKAYRVPPGETDLRQALLIRVDAVPESLVLAQAAIESGWGTSRFAQQGNNLFGQWCFQKGCGLVPSLRSDDARHEVQKFESVAESVRSYLFNLNTHPAYRLLRERRWALRRQQKPLSGCYLAEGLGSYSQKGGTYVEMVKQVVRVNRLEQNNEHCQGTAVALTEESAKEAQEQ